MSDAYKIVWWAIIFAIGMGLMITTAHADEWSTPDKRQHKIASGIATVAVYPVLRANDVEYSAEWAAGGVIMAGVFKEVVLDPRGIGNGVPSKPSGKDAAANAIGAGIAYGMIKSGEWLGDTYGFNPFYWEF